MLTLWRSIGLCLLMLVFFGSCGRKEEQIVDVNDLLRIELGKIVPVSPFLKKPADIICVLPPYDGEVRGEVPHRKQINARLKSIPLFPNEGWVMVFVKDDVVTLQTFKAQPISPLRAHEGKPKGFRPVQCTSVDRAVFTRIDSISFTGALMLGEQ